jgi:hypothetical protein
MSKKLKIKYKLKYGTQSLKTFQTMKLDGAMTEKPE